MKRPTFIIPVLFIACGMMTITATAQAQTTWYVDDDAPNDPGPGDPAVSDPLEDGSSSHPYDAVQEGIDAATIGDTVIVKDGTYTGTGNWDIVFNGKAITVRSEHGPDGCIIDCENNSSGFNLHHDENENSIIQGFTVQNADCGIICYGNDAYTSPTIIHNIIQNNSQGIYCGGQCSANIFNNLITGNSRTGGSGGGIYCQEGKIINNVITNNACQEGGGIAAVCGETQKVQIVNNLIAGNDALIWGGGIEIEGHGSATIVNNTILGNTTSPGFSGGGGIGVAGGHEPHPSVVVSNTILRDNTAADGNQIGISLATLNISHSDVEGGEADVFVYVGSTLNWGTGMIDADPMFTTGPLGDYYLLQPVSSGLSLISPCVDAGDPAFGMINGTTRIDELQDFGIIDMGYHYPDDMSYAGPNWLDMIPDSGDELHIQSGN